MSDEKAEDEVAVMEEFKRLISTYHEAGRFGMLRIALGPCTPFACTEEFFVQCADLAKQTPGE